MYLKKLELTGFKSFPDKTTLRFEPGITAIVGPNGCGKSNIFDSIRWVLGEQSIKSLRGTRMEDVIFSGTDKAESLGMAEVSLTFSNENRFFPLDEKEFVITRQLFRSGESEYLLNKNQVRLKDINELFMGTGVGAEAYSLVEQGKIDLILSSRPEERRMVFDEAAGITKYKSDKREALRRLEETEDNLLRINDIINEVKRQIGSLERQANRARRYKEIFEEVKTKDTQLAAFQVSGMVQEKEALLQQVNLLKEKLELSQSEYAKVLAQEEARNSALKELEEEIYKTREEILGCENIFERNSQHCRFNQERTREFLEKKESLNLQINQSEGKIRRDQEKIDNFNQEYNNLKNNIAEKTNALQSQESRLEEIFNLIKAAQAKIIQAKKDIFELINVQTKVKNDIIDLNMKLQSFLAREKRLEIEKAKTGEEKANIEESQSAVKRDLKEVELIFNNLNERYLSKKIQVAEKGDALESLKNEIQTLEKEKAGLLSQKEFLETLNLKYQEIHESMDAVILLDRKPKGNISGMVIKVKTQSAAGSADRAVSDGAHYKLCGEAKPITLNTAEILAKISQISGMIADKNNSMNELEKTITQLDAEIKQMESDLRQQEISLADKRSQYNNINEQLNKINEEIGLVTLELDQTKSEVGSLKEREAQLLQQQAELEKSQQEKEKISSEEQRSVANLNTQREENIILGTQLKTELEALSKRLSRDNDTLKMFESALKTDREALTELENQVRQSDAKVKTLESESARLTKENQEISLKKADLKVKQDGAEQKLKEIKEVLHKDNSGLGLRRKEIETFKDDINKFLMQIQEMDFKIIGTKDRIAQSYKIDLESMLGANREFNTQMLSEEVRQLKEKLDSYGSVNLVAIEEYDELKKRYDFLVQQQNDLVRAKESLHEAILKINRTTKKMFLDTFKLITEEFRNYFKLLFNGGEGNLFLIDENDPLESGIEIICRPPGKKAQNVSLLSGGEKSLSAIALIFAIFKVRPSPFCILDEVDAALDEANVDRYSRLLCDFSQMSQFIVITHNKRTIANANVMYGITMEEQGVSKIVSVKFSDERSAEESLAEEEVVTT